jgi:hypothetical protein
MSCSTFICDRYPEKFGGQQADYQQQVIQIVREGAREVRRVREAKGDLIALFNALIKRLAEERARIAQAHNTYRQEKFGLLRTERRGFQVTHTILVGEYREYGERIKGMLKRWLEAMGSETKQTFLLAEGAAVEVERLETKTLAERKWNEQPALNLPQAGHEAGHEAGHSQRRLTRQEVQQLKKENKELYTRTVMFTKLLLLEKKFPRPQVEGGRVVSGEEKHLRSFFVRAIVKQQVEGKLYHLFEYFTWLYRDSDNRPYERMMNCSTATLFHFDPLNIDQPALPDMGKLFERAVLSSDFVQMKQNLGQLRRFMGSVMLWCRGSAAITEWVEQIVSGSLGFRMSYMPALHPDLESYAEPNGPQYIANYAQGKFCQWHPVRFETLVDQQSCIAYLVAAGKPNPKERAIPNFENRCRVLQPANKGKTAFYSVLNLLRQRIGPNHDPALVNLRQIEKRFSDYRKQLSLLEMGTPSTCDQEQKQVVKICQELHIPTDKNSKILRNLLWIEAARQYGLVQATWTPLQGCDALYTSLKQHGPHLFVGELGRLQYLNAPQEIPSAKLGNCPVLGWPPHSPKKTSEHSAHAILVIGVNKERQLIYYLDPEDPSDPAQGPTQIIYVTSYNTFSSRLFPLHGSEMRSNTDSYAIHSGQL